MLAFIVGLLTLGVIFYILYLASKYTEVLFVLFIGIPFILTILIVGCLLISEIGKLVIGLF